MHICVEAGPRGNRLYRQVETQRFRNEFDFAEKAYPSAFLAITHIAATGIPRS
jgi:hypothetical protein